MGDIGRKDRVMSNPSVGRVTCEHCGKNYRWRREYAGRRTRCAACGGIVVMPLESPEADQRTEPVKSEIRITCDSCRKHIRAPHGAAGRRIKCPRAETSY